MPQDTIIEVLRTEEKMNQIREQTAADCRQKLLMAQPVRYRHRLPDGRFLEVHAICYVIG